VGLLNGGTERSRVSVLTTFKKVFNESKFNKLSVDKKDEIRELLEKIQRIME